LQAGLSAQAFGALEAQSIAGASMEGEKTDIENSNSCLQW